MIRFRSAATILLATWLGGCKADVPGPGTEAYLEASGAFYSGVAAMQVGDDLRARAKLERVIEIVPTEDAAHANLVLLALRRGELEAAAAAASQITAGLDASASIRRIVALAHASRGDTARAQAALAGDSHPASLVLRADLLRAGDTQAALDLVEEAARQWPANQALSFRVARARAAAGDPAAGRDWAAALAMDHAPHPDEGVLTQVLSDVAATDQVLRALDRAGNVLVRADWFRRDLDVIQVPPELVANPVERPVALPPAPQGAAPADRALVLRPEVLPLEPGDWSWSGTAHLGDASLPSVLLARGSTLELPDRTQIALSAPLVGRHAVAIQDFDQDFLQDLAVIGPAGVTIHFQQPDGRFAERPGSTPPLAGASAVWAADIDMEGDLDLVVGFPEAPARVLTNLGDGTFVRGETLPLPGLSAFVWGDLDGDGDPDVAGVTAEGTLTYIGNLRNGRWELPRTLATGVDDIALDDRDANAVFDLAILQSGRPAVLLGTDAPAVPVEVLGTSGMTPSHRLLLADLDNNGAMDWVVGGPSHTQVLLTEPDGTLWALPPSEAVADAIAPLSDDGAPALVGRDIAGTPAVYFPEGQAGYHWRRLRPRTAEVQGDRRINTFAVGGEVELRSGLLFQKQPISGGLLHFGLGENLLTEVARIVWPNGDVQVEFDLLSDETVLAQQRLKGSCPWVFTYDGTGMTFVTDFLWRSPLGLRINAQETAGIATTSDWVRIPGSALRAVDGQYEIRITAELWETHFFDHVALQVVDHPVGSETWVDERFAFPPPTADVQFFQPSRPFAGVWDAAGQSADDLAARRDGKHVAGFALGAYQGLAQEHAVELLLPPEAPSNAVLHGFGWVRPTDSSINVALGQGVSGPPISLQLEVPDGHGGWKTARRDLGFPSGKQKTVLIDLAGLWAEGTERRFRLRTNLEVYWDRLVWAAPVPAPDSRQSIVAPGSATLRYRGFSRVRAADAQSPELPSYDELLGTHPVWRDLVGYYTRFGAVDELIAETDDRYVIMNAGDELVLRFPAPAPPPEGWTRDFVLLGDGWVKDGDLNTTFSTSVLPLPTHEDTGYDRPPTVLEEDPVYIRHADDWRQYHTRYVAPDRFASALSVRR